MILIDSLGNFENISPSNVFESLSLAFFIIKNDFGILISFFFRIISFINL